jgi:hypothetical protein
MAIGNAYRAYAEIKDNDIFLGTRAENRKTANFTAQSVADYLNANGKISVGGQMTWKFKTTTPLQGTFTFPNLGGNGTPFSSITTLRLANNDLGEQRVVEFVNYLMGTDILIAEQKELSFFGHYKITGYVPDSQPGFHIITLEYLGGSGNLVMDAVYDMAIFNPFPNDDKNYVHTQNVASATWNIEHNLDKFASATVVDSGNNVVVGDITYNDTNNLTITFSGAFSGKAYIN